MSALASKVFHKTNVFAMKLHLHNHTDFNTS